MNVSRAIAFSLLLLIARRTFAYPLMQTTTHGVVVTRGATVQGKSAIPGCPDATSYAAYMALANGCYQESNGAPQPSVMTFTSYNCSYTGPTNLCTPLGVDGANITMSLDHLGCFPAICPDTIFFGNSPSDSGQSFPAQPGVTGGSPAETLDVTFGGTVYGSTKTGPWPHWKIVNTTYTGQTLTGTLVMTTTVACGANCISPAAVGGVSTNVLTCNLANNGLASITATSITSNVLTVTAANSYTAGNVVVLNGTTESFLHGQVVTVLSSGLSGAQFEANFTQANYTNASDTGTSGLTPCNDTNSIAPYNVFNTTYNAATSGAPYAWTIDIQWNGGSNASGTAWLKDIAMHF